MSAENGGGYNTFEQPPPYPDSYKNEPYQSQQQLRPDQYYPLPGGKLFSYLSVGSYTDYIVGADLASITIR